uniref:Steroid 21-hydroxylase n=1 Tax=Cyanistes caeruleus TaxID=156563 RepID=A0A8C0UWB1_CYACU
GTLRTSNPALSPCRWDLPKLQTSPQIPQIFPEALTSRRSTQNPTPGFTTWFGTPQFCGPPQLLLFPPDVLVPSSVGTIREALVRHWGDWLGRPTSYLGSLVSRGGRDLALGGPCPGWRRQRGAVRGALAQAGGRLGPLLWLQGQKLCEVPPPGELRAFSRCLGELLQVWGHSSVRALDLLPLLRALPNPGLRKLLQLVQHRDTFVEAQIQRHQACPSPPPDTVLGALLGHNSGARGGSLSPPRLHMALVDLFIGGTETTAAALGWAVAFLLHRPELQARLRAELEGAHGPPGPGDTGRLPLLQATVSETLRLRPPAPLALPHCALRHTSLGGLPVVAGTVLVPNLLAAQQDPDIWQHPEVFLPGTWVRLHSEVPAAKLLGSPQTSNWISPVVMGFPLTPGYPGNTLAS